MTGTTMASFCARTSYVCFSCRRRKKACDKKFPRCTYCEIRNLACHYDETPPSKLDTSDESLYIDPIMPGPCMRRSMCETVLHILSQLGQHSGGLCDQFWHGLHCWLPFMSRGTFDQSMSQFPTSQSADFGVLLLSVCLVSRDVPTPIYTMNQSSLYLATKTLLAQLHSSDLTSLDSLKAAMLVSIYEYVTHDGDEAFVTLSMAIRTAYTLGIDQEPAQCRTLGQDLHETNNLWWMLVICERLFVLETRNPSQPLITPFPSSTRPPPKEVVDTESGGPLLPSAPSIGFERAAQASAMLDEVLVITRNRCRSMTGSEVARIDAALQSFLIVVLEECIGTWASFCGAASTAIRAMFVLHKSLLAHQQYGPELCNAARNSKAALVTATKLMVDIAISHNNNVNAGDISALPPTCVYILRESLHVTQTSDQNESQKRHSIEALRGLLELFMGRWNKGLSDAYICAGVR